MSDVPNAPPVSAGDRATVLQVEQEAHWRVWLLFGLLFVVLYVPVFLALLLVLLSHAALTIDPAALSWTRPLVAIAVLAGLMTIVFAIAAWLWAGRNVRERLMTVMHARPLDPSDSFHQQLAHVVAELGIAAGLGQLECVIIPDAGTNAFAFSNLRGGGCVGATEGLVARLDRQQLQAVMAHEVAHLASRDCITATRACTLFLATSALADRLDRVGWDRPANRDAITWAVILRPVIGLMQLGSAVVNAAISREREYIADAAAVRYTHDPLSLAEALRIIGRRPGGDGAIPFGLSPLCLRPTREVARGSIAAVLATHPPLESRISRLEDFAARAPGSAPGEQPRARFDDDSQRPPEAVGPSVPLSGTNSAAGAGVGCPVCGVALQAVDYEGTEVLACRTCGGRLLTGWQTERILARRRMGFSDAQRRLADLIAAEIGGHVSAPGHRAAAAPRAVTAQIACPKCARPMLRQVFSYAYPIEIDHCKQCELRWFDKDELEVLQILVERATG